jgi:hypothetical protein
VSHGQWISLAILAGTIALSYSAQIGALLQDAETRKALLGKLKHVLVLAALVYALSQFTTRKNPEPSPRPVAVALVTEALQSAPSSDRKAVAGVYRALADVTERDNGRLITSTSVWRAIHSDALRLAVGGTDLVGKYPGLDTAVEKTLAKHFSLDNLPLTPDLVANIAAGCRAVEAQCE